MLLGCLPALSGRAHWKVRQAESCAERTCRLVCAGVRGRDLCAVDATWLKRKGISDPVRLRIEVQEREKQRKAIVEAVLAQYERICIEQDSQHMRKQRQATSFSVTSLPSIVEELPPPAHTQLTPGMFSSSQALVYQRKHTLQQAVMAPMLQELKQLEKRCRDQVGQQRKAQATQAASKAREDAVTAARNLQLHEAQKRSALAAQRQQHAEEQRQRQMATQAERSAQAAEAQRAKLEAAAEAAKAAQDAKVAALAEAKRELAARVEQKRKRDAKLMRRLRKRQRKERAKQAKINAMQKRHIDQEEAERLETQKRLRQEAQESAKRRALDIEEKRRKKAAAAAQEKDLRISEITAERQKKTNLSFSELASSEHTKKLEMVRARALAQEKAAAEQTATRLALTDMIAERQRQHLKAQQQEAVIQSRIKFQQKKRAIRRAKKRHAVRRRQREAAWLAKRKRMEQLAQQKEASAALIRQARHEAEITRAALRAEIDAAAHISPEEALRKIEIARAQMTKGLLEQASILEISPAKLGSEVSQMHEFSSILSVSSPPRGNSAVEQLRNLQIDMSQKYDAMAAAVGRARRPFPSVSGSIQSESTTQLLERASEVGGRAGASWALGSASTAELLQSSSLRSQRPKKEAVPPPPRKQRNLSTSLDVGNAAPGTIVPPADGVVLNMEHPLLKQTTWLKTPRSPKETDAESGKHHQDELHAAAKANKPLLPPSEAIQQYEQLGYFDDHGKWHLYEDEGYYDDDGVWQFFEGYYDDEGKWHAYADEGYYDDEGHWHEFSAADDLARAETDTGVEGIPSSPESSATSLDSMVSVQKSAQEALEFDEAMQEALRIRERVLNTRSTLTTEESDWEVPSHQSTEVGKHQQKHIFTEGSLGDESLLFAQAYSVSAYRAEPNG